MWYQLTIRGQAKAQVNDIEEQLLALGALSITVTDTADCPVLEPAPGETPLWQLSDITALFDDLSQQKNASKQLKTKDKYLEIELSQFEDESWERAWMADFKPMHFGKKLWVCPSHCQAPDAQATNIYLDPGLAFGSGTHPTTAMCLKFLADAKLKQQEIIDFGCGSGILAIAALKLGAKKAYCIDIDPQAVSATLDNACRNQIDIERVDACLSANFTLKAPVPLLLANILAQPLIELAPQLLTYLAPKGKLVLSGLLTEQINDVLAAYLEHCQLLEQKQQQEWACLVLEKH